MNAIMRVMMTKFGVAAVAFLAVVMTASAQVKIDMPAPRKPVSHPPTVVTTATASMAVANPASSSVDVGDLALHRYARVRTGTYDTYVNGPRYAGIRQYGYPFPLFWGWNWGIFPFGFGFHHHHHHSSSLPMDSSVAK